MQDRETTGQFWLPERPPDDSFSGVGGVLRFSRVEGLVVELSDRLGSDLGPVDSVPVILGVGHDGKELTLLDCLLKNWNVSSSVGGWEIAGASYRPQLAYIGSHLTSEVDRVFVDAFVSIDGLNSWVPSSGFETEFPVDRGLPSSATYVPPPDYSAVHDSATIKLEPFLERREERRSVMMGEGWRFDLELPSPMGLGEIRSTYIQPLLNLLTLVTQRPAIIQSLRVHAESAREPGSAQFFRPLEVLYSPVGVGEPSDRYQAPLIALRDFPVEFGEFVPRWLRVSSDADLGPVLDAYFGIQYSPPGFVELRFSTLATALESYHQRRFSGATSIPQEAFSRRAGLLTDLAKHSEDFRTKDRKWLKGMLKSANRPALHQRITHLLEIVNECHPMPLEEIATIATKLADTRNHLAHGTDELAERALTGLERFWGEQLLFLTLANLLLKELGLDDSFIAESWAKHPWYSWARKGIGSVEWA